MKTKQSQQPKPEAKQTAAAPAPAKPPATPKPTKPAKKKAAKGKTGGAAKRKREGMSGLDAAAKVLASSKEPLGCTEMVERILEEKLWKTGGKTPAATISAAILREIRDKGKESRFKKVGRGKFAATK